MIQKGKSELIEYVLKQASENDVKFIRLWFPDILGNLKGFGVTIDELEIVIERGASFDGASLLGSERSEEREYIAYPDPSTFQILPWRPQENSVARMICDIKDSDGKPVKFDSRNLLIENLSKASKLGFNFYVGTEIEFFYLDGIENPKPIDNDGYFDQAPTKNNIPSNTDLSAKLRRETVLALESMGIPIQNYHHEVAPGQHEIVLRHTNALTMADSIISYKSLAKQIAMNQDVYATFMPKPFNNLDGSGMHTHISLFKGNENLFYDSKDPFYLSKEAKQFMAGLYKHSPEITAITNQWVNSYKRLVPGFEAPAFNSLTFSGGWGNLIRVPKSRPEKGNSVRLEYRSPDPACNPYLAFSVILAAGLEGIKNSYKIPNKQEQSNIIGERLPTNLKDALDKISKSSLVKKSLGKETLEIFLNNKYREWDEYQKTVSESEIKKYINL
ncbi:MAG: glutamine synthetase [Chloroflexi bacterium]|nr:glutamine synthetase [Chloroflexota bacterium]